MSALVASPATFAAKAEAKKAAAATERAAKVARLRRVAQQAVRLKDYGQAERLFAKARSLEATGN